MSPTKRRLRIADGEAIASPIPVERENAPTARDSISIGGAALRASPDLFEDQQADAPEIIPAAESAAKPAKTDAMGGGDFRRAGNPDSELATARTEHPSRRRRHRRGARMARAARDLGSGMGGRRLAALDRDRPACVRQGVRRRGGRRRGHRCGGAERGARRRTRRAFCRGSAGWLDGGGWAKPPPAKAKRGAREVAPSGRATTSRASRAACWRSPSGRHEP